MAQYLRLAVHEPCHEDWNLMSVEEKGRHCQSCNKVVVDFTGMTDAEIVAHFTTYKGNTCGRFRTEQLERDIRLGGVPRTIRPIKYLAVSLLAFQLFSNRTQARDVITLPDTVQTERVYAGIDSDTLATKDSCGEELGYAWQNAVPDTFHIKVDTSYFICTEINGFTTYTLGGASPYVEHVDTTTFDGVIAQRSYQPNKEGNMVNYLWDFIYRYTPLRLLTKPKPVLPVEVAAPKNKLPERNNKAAFATRVAVLAEQLGLKRRRN